GLLGSPPQRRHWLQVRPQEQGLQPQRNCAADSHHYSRSLRPYSSHLCQNADASERNSVVRARANYRKKMKNRDSVRKSGQALETSRVAQESICRIRKRAAGNTAPSG